MKFGVTLPELKPRVLSGMAKEVEACGWDGLFAWDMIYGIDVWISLAAVAMVTERIHFGSMLTPLTRRRPWKVASEGVTLDHLSNGRVVLPVGLGATGEGHTHNWFEQVGEELDRKVRAKRLDESLDIIKGLWSGEPFSYSGEHYEIKNITFSPKPVQPQRVPIWVVGAWPRMKSMRRVLGCDGILPVKMNQQRQMQDLKPDDIRQMKGWIEENRRETTPFDIVVEGETAGGDANQAASIVQPLADAGVTWWLESVWATPETEGGIEGMRKRIKQGPPQIK